MAGNRTGFAIAAILLALAAVAISFVLMISHNARASGSPDGKSSSAGLPSEASPGEFRSPGPHDWLAIGPFSDPKEAAPLSPDPIDRDWLAMGGGERLADPGPIQPATGPAWLPAKVDGDRLDVSDFVRGSGGVIYGFRRLDPGPAREVDLVVASPAPIKVFLDGKIVYARYGREGGGGGTERVRLSLSGSESRLLVKIEARPGDRGPSLSFAPTGSGAFPEAGRVEPRLFERVVPEGRPLEGVVIRSSAASEPIREIVATDASGHYLASARTDASGRFLLRPPADFRGIVELRLGTSGPVAARGFVGDFALASEARAMSARTALSSASSRLAATDWDPVPTLTFAIASLEGIAPSPFSDLEARLFVLAEIDGLLSSIGRPLTSERTWRLALSSPLDREPLPYEYRAPRTRDLPILIALHDRGETDLEAARRIEEASQDNPVAFLAPYGGADASWRGPWEDLLALELEATLGLEGDSASHSAATQKPTVIMGWGEGATAALRLALEGPDRFCGILSFAGRPWPDGLGALEGLPVLLAAAESDPALPAALLREDAARLLAAGVRLETAVFPGATAGEAFSAWATTDRLRGWLESAAAAPRRQGIELLTATVRHGRSSRFALGEITNPSKPALLRFDPIDDHHAALSVENVAEIFLDLASEGFARSGSILLDLDGKIVVLDAGARVRLVAGPDGSLQADSSDRLMPTTTAQAPEAAKLASPEPPARAAPDGEGFGSLFRAPLLIVYGSKPGPPAAADKALALAIGEEARRMAGLAEWPLVVPDSAAIPALLEGRNLLLVGSADSNALLAKTAGEMPLRARRDGVGVADSPSGFGCAVVFADPQRSGGTIGILSLPYEAGLALRLADEALAPLLRPLGAVAAGESFRTPDLVLWDRGGKLVYAASFDAAISRCFEWRRP